MNFDVYRYNIEYVKSGKKQFANVNQVSISRLMKAWKIDRGEYVEMKIRNKKLVKKCFYEPHFINEVQKEQFYAICAQHGITIEEIHAYDLMHNKTRRRIREAVLQMNYSSVLLTPEFVEDITGTKFVRLG